MEDNVCVISGQWTCCDKGFWRFNVRNGQMARCVCIGKITSFKDLEREILKAFGVKDNENDMVLTFWYEPQNPVFTQRKMPPVKISSDTEVANFRNKSVEYGGLNMYATFTPIEGAKEGENAKEGGNAEEGTNGRSVGDIDLTLTESTISDSQLLALVNEVEEIYKTRLNEGQCNKVSEVVVPLAKGLGGFVEDTVGNHEEDSVHRECDVVDNLTNSQGQLKESISTDVDKIQMDEDHSRDLDGQVDERIQLDKGKGIAIAVEDDEQDSEAAGATDCDEGDYTDPDYNFDDWTDRINKEYPPNWNPYQAEGKSICEVGQASGECLMGDGIDNIEPIGFSLGIEEIGEESAEIHEDETHNTMVPYEGDNTEVFEDDFMVDRCAVINGEDPILLNDAPPVHDNMRSTPTDEKNMDLKRASDAIYVGKIFANKAEMRNVLSTYAMKRLFTFRILKSDKTRCIATCVDKRCGWRIYATNHPNSQNLEVRTVHLKHTCDVAARSRYGEKATAKVLADLLQKKFANGKKGPRACELPEMVLGELNVTISYTKAWNAKELAIAAARGNEEESYRFLATYLHLVKSTNPGTISEIQSVVDKKGKTLFKYLFFAFGASVTGYKYLRKVIVIDGTAMKGKYKGCLVAASCQDGNLQIYPLAFGVVDGENEKGWVWFFKNLKKFVPDEEDLVFVSDRHAAIYAGLRQIYPRAHHAACVVHLVRNVQHRYKCGGLSSIVSKAARAYTVGDFRYWWAEIEKRRPKCAEYLLNIGLPHWTLSHFPGNRYNVMSSNISESLNAALQKAVDYPIVSMVEFIRSMLMRWFWCRRTLAGKTHNRCTPEIEWMLIEQHNDSVDCGVLSASEWIYQVNDGNGCVFTVDLANKTCTCKVFDVLMVPCSHALAARKVLDIDIYSLVGKCYFVEPWRKMYETVIMPVPKERDTDVPETVKADDVNPPKTKRGGGRPRKVRIPSQGEVNKHGKRKRVIKCGRCFGEGHNRKRCTNLI